MPVRSLALVALTVMLTGCFNDQKSWDIELGDVSLGEQLIDLKRAQEQGALSAAEYREIKARLMDMLDIDEDDLEEAHERHAKEQKRRDDDDEDDGFRWF